MFPVCNRIPLDDDCCLIFEFGDHRICGRHVQGPGEFQTDMFVDRMTVEGVHRRFQNVRGRHGARWNTPSNPIVQKCGFRLGTGQTELAGVAACPPGGLVAAQQAQSFGNIVLCQPFDLTVRFIENGRHTFRAHELNDAGAVFSNM